MTTAKLPAQSPPDPAAFQLPDPPPRHPDEMTSVEHLHEPGNTHHLAQFLGNPDTTLVTAERYIAREPGSPASERRVPDLLIAFDMDPAAYRAASTGRSDVEEKRDAYAAFGILEYWRFDPTGEHHGARLAGDRLEGGRYVPITIDELNEDVLQGYSAALNLHLRWEAGRLGWHDPATGEHIPTYASQRARADQERAARIQAEARIRELENELHRLRNQ